MKKLIFLSLCAVLAGCAPYRGYEWDMETGTWQPESGDYCHTDPNVGLTCPNGYHYEKVQDAKYQDGWAWELKKDSLKNDHLKTNHKLQ